MIPFVQTRRPSGPHRRRSSTPAPAAASSLNGPEFYLDGNQFKKLQDAFHEVDRDEDAALDRSELQDMWRILFPNMPVSEIRDITDDIFKDLDPNRDGEVSFGELRNYILNEGHEKTDIDALLEDQVPQPGPSGISETVWAVVEMDSARYSDAPRWLRPTRTMWMLTSQCFIVVSCVAMIVESLPSLQSNDQEPGNATTFILETVCVAFFSLEIVLRFAFCPSIQVLVMQFFTWVDILSVVPYYLSFAIHDNPTGALLVLRVVRLLRLLRVLKIGRQFLAVQLMVIAITRCIQPLLVLMIGVNIITVTLIGSVVYTVELTQSTFNETQQKWFRNADSNLLDQGQPLNFQSIPDGMWWALVTMTTVGYGDTVPHSELGKTVASVTMIIGLILLAFPLTLISSSFQDVSKEMCEKKMMHERRRAFRHQIARSSALSLQRPMVLLEIDDFVEGMPVVHATRGPGSVAYVSVRDAVVHVQFDNERTSCFGARRYGTASLSCGKIRALYGLCDFPVGMPVRHQTRGQGVVGAVDTCVAVRFESGEQHRYKQASLAKGKLVPLADPADYPPVPHIMPSAPPESPRPGVAPSGLARARDDGGPRVGTVASVELKLDQFMGESRAEMDSLAQRIDGVAAEIRGLRDLLLRRVPEANNGLARGLGMHQESGQMEAMSDSQVSMESRPGKEAGLPLLPRTQAPSSEPFSDE
eukprot:TRINITY_DN4314_c0_g1_i1.p1 TRINITY_DN4314_c0_g1~~TRINITY_DN4314_c0_g1_i1.p1  ORF type:complete len:701 (+),score=216.57 TRINITY_DN4314_c0_g1_i1:109-2211(+)